VSDIESEIKVLFVKRAELISKYFMNLSTIASATEGSDKSNFIELATDITLNHVHEIVKLSGKAFDVFANSMKGSMHEGFFHCAYKTFSDSCKIPSEIAEICDEVFTAVEKNGIKIRSICAA